MRHRDLGILFVSGLAAFLCLQGQDDYAAKRHFTIDIDPAHYKNHHTPTDSERIPPPIITDIDGDGQNELIVVTRDPKIFIYDTTTSVGQKKLRSKKNTADLKTHLLVQAESTLLSKARIRSARQPVAVATGYLEKDSKHQHIVVLTHDWTVMCFDHNLKLIWEQHPMKKKYSDTFHKEAAIYIGPTSVRTKDKGIVIVGASLDLAHYERFYKRAAKVTSKTHKHEGHHRKQKNHEKRQKKIRKHLVQAILRGKHKTREQVVAHAAEMEKDSSITKEKELEDLKHFSYYAFDGRTGGLRWKQESGDWSLQDRENKIPQHNYKLDFHSETKHAGEVDWRQYRVSILNTLPHKWDRKEDTRFNIAHFSKRTKGNAEDDTIREAALHAREVGLFDSIRLPASKTGSDTFKTVRDAETKNLPNVLVSHMQEGIEVIHLYTGRTLCQLPLPPHTLNADVNHDGAIDRVEAVMGVEGESIVRPMGHEAVEEEGQSCYAWVTTGSPPTHALFNKSICNPDSSFRGLVSSLQKQVRAAQAEQEEEDSTDLELQVAMPGLVTRAASKDTSGRLIQSSDIVFAVSDGTVSSFSPAGILNWQVSTPAYWVQPALVREVDATERSAQESERHLIEVDAYPEVKGFPLKTDGDEEVTLMIGMYNAVLLGHDGTKLAQFRLPDVPLAASVIGDFDSDGYTDIILSTRTGYHGFTVSTKQPNHLLSFLLGALLLALALLASSTAFSSTTSAFSSHDRSDRVRGAAPVSATRRLKKERATD